MYTGNVDIFSISLLRNENESKSEGCTSNPIYLYGVFWKDKIDEITCEYVYRYSTFNNFVNTKNVLIVGMHIYLIYTIHKVWKDIESLRFV